MLSSNRIAVTQEEYEVYKLIIIFSIRLASDEKRTLKNVKEREFYFTILVKREIDTSLFYMLNYCTNCK